MSNRPSPNHPGPSTVTAFIDESLLLFLKPEHRRPFQILPLGRRRSIKDFVESLGIPHVEIGGLRLNDRQVNFDAILTGGESIQVLAPTEPVDPTRPDELQRPPLPKIRFLCDVHLGKLTRFLRLLGFDTAYRNHHGDDELIEIATGEQRLLLTRDRFLLRRARLIHGYFVRHTQPADQIREVVRRYGLHRFSRPFSRCPMCNGILQSVEKQEVLHRLPPMTANHFNAFYQCRTCSKLYWPGSHFKKLEAWVRDWLEGNTA